MGESPTREGASGAPATNWTQVAIAVLTLALGTLVYVLDRPAGSVPFFSAIHLAEGWPALFGRIGDSLPTFVHAFAFSVLTAAWLGGARRFALPACLTWFGVDSALEAGQHPRFAQTLADLVPGWFDALPILGRADSYFLRGTFDVIDLISIALGAAAAYLLIRCTGRTEESHG
jgi:hypothetical protein